MVAQGQVFQVGLAVVVVLALLVLLVQEEDLLELTVQHLLVVMVGKILEVVDLVLVLVQEVQVVPAS